MLNRCEDLILENESRKKTEENNCSLATNRSDQDIFKAPLPPKELRVTLNKNDVLKHAKSLTDHGNEVDSTDSTDRLKNQTGEFGETRSTHSSRVSGTNEDNKTPDIVRSSESSLMKTASPKPDETEENRVNPESVPIIILDQSVSVFQPEIANSTINVKNKHVSQNSVELTNVCSKNDLEVTETNSRPVRNRTKNKKYFDDNMLTDVSLSKKESTVKQTNIPDVVISSANSMSEQCDNKGSSSSNNTRRGTKRLSDSDTIEPLKKKKAVIDQGDGGVIVTENGKSGSDVSGRNPTSAKDDLGSMEAEPHRSRTRTLTKPTVSNIVVISPYSNSDVPKSKDSPTKPSDK